MRFIFNPPRLTRKRMIVAMTVAVAADAVQLILGPLGIAMFFVDDVLDVAAALVISAAVGFHPLLLPTFVAELVPVVDMVPTWTGCTIAVLALRKRARDRAPASEPPSIPNTGDMKRAQAVSEKPAEEADPGKGGR